MTIGLAILISILGSVFNIASDADFLPSRANVWFAAIHWGFGALLFVLLAPVWLLEPFGLSGRDAVCLIFSSACYGIIVSYVWLVVARWRRKSQANGRA